MLELLVAEADQGFERRLVPEPVIAAHFEHLRVDEALDQTEQVGVGAALHLAQQAALGLTKETELIDFRQSTGEEPLCKVELPAADHVGVDVPADALGGADGARIPAAVIDGCGVLYDLGGAFMVEFSLEVGMSVAYMMEKPHSRVNGKDVPTTPRDGSNLRELCPDVRRATR